MLMGWRRGTAVLWSVQGDAAAGVEVGDEGRRRRSSCGLVHREEEEESEKERGRMRGESMVLFIRLEGHATSARIEEAEMDKRRRRRLKFRRESKEEDLLKIWVL